MGVFGREDPEAGRSAQAYYETALASWRRRNRAAFAVALAIAALLAMPAWRYLPLGQFFAGLMVGGALGMVVWIWDDPPELIAKWKRGADGERLTARTLKRLEQDGWQASHDRAGRFGNLDHIVVGPGGVFLLDSKNLSGSVTLEPAGLTTSYADAPRDGFTNAKLERAMRGAAVHLKERVAASTGLTYFVRPVVVVWGHFPAGAAEQDGVSYVSGDSSPTGCWDNQPDYPPATQS